MKTAEEMFDKLEFYKSTDVKSVIIQYVKNVSGFFGIVLFHKENKTYSVIGNFAIYNIDLELHHAIHQQLKELGWI